MELLLTERFLARARTAPAGVSEGLAREAARAPEGGAPLGAALEDRRVLGFSRRPQGLALWFLEDALEAGRPGEPGPLASMSRAELRDLGVEEGLLGAVQAVRGEAQLSALGLPEPLASRLRFALVQRAQGLSAREEELQYRATDLRHLDRWLRGELSQLLLNLDASQRPIVELGGPGPIIVRGVAGSGKTAVALHRIYAGLRQRSLLAAPRILFLTFNRALAAVAGELLVSLGLRPDDVEVSTVHRWCRAFAASPLRLFPSPGRRRELLEEARAGVRDSLPAALRSSALWGYPPTFWADEIHRIKGHGVDTAEAYEALHRYGAGRPLDGRLRAQVFLVYRAYRDLQQARGLWDWDDVVRLAFDKLGREGAGAPRYDQVVVDEAQDLTVMAMRVASALCRPEGTLLVSYDPAQSIYERGFRWKNYGIAVHGSRSFDLRRNFRNTAEILAAARPLLSGMRDQVETGESRRAEEVLVPELPPRHGAEPRLLAVERGQELSAVAASVAALVRDEGVPPQNIAVLCYPNAVRDRAWAALREAGILCQKHDEETLIRVGDPSVKVLPLKSAKGLEFPVVYLLASGADFRPPVRGERERAAWLDQMGRCFYMAMTRAMAKLVVVYARGDPAPFLRAVLARATREAPAAGQGPGALRRTRSAR